MKKLQDGEVVLNLVLFDMILLFFVLPPITAENNRSRRVRRNR